VQLQVGDVRGWQATKSVVLSEPQRHDDWTPISVDYLPLHDTKSLIISPRRREAAEAGQFSMRNLTIQPFRLRSAGRVPELAAFATTTAKHTAVFLINRRITGALTVHLAGVSFANAQGEVLTGPSPDATNEQGDVVVVKPLVIRAVANGIAVDVPPHAFAVVNVPRNE
jgi:hypothetical protein